MDCIARLTGAAGDLRSVLPHDVGERLYEHGRAGADALVPLLAHSSEEVRRLAAIALDQFEDVPPHHAPALIAAHRRGLDVAEAIARTGSDEALRYLESGWSFGDEGHAVRRALPLMGSRAVPFLLRELERCRQSCSRREADSLLYALDNAERPLPDAAWAVIRDVAASPTADAELRLEMEDQIIGRGDPAALPILARRLGALRGVPYEDAIASRLFERVYTNAAAAASDIGPVVLSYLPRRDLRRARIRAVATSWIVGYRPAVPALRALLAEADGDWLLAYDAIFALGQLGGTEARPEIARLARDHWYAPVRNNARRALNSLDGGEFTLLELRDTEERSSYVGDLHFGADLDAVRDCRFERVSEVQRFGRNAPVRARRPERGAVRIVLDRAERDTGDSLSGVRGIPTGVPVTLLWQQRAGRRVVGFDGERVEGGLFVLDPDGGNRRILADSVLATFDMAGSLIVVTGDSTRFSDEADLWRLASGTLAVLDGPLRLPATPTGYALASDRTLLIRTERGDLAVDREGRLRAPRACPAATAAQ